MTGRNYLKTTLLLAAMSGLLLGIGALLGGSRDGIKIDRWPVIRPVIHWAARGRAVPGRCCW